MASLGAFCDTHSKNVRARIEKQLPELGRIAQWLNAGCPLETAVTATIVPAYIAPTYTRCQEILLETLGELSRVKPTPIQRICQEILLVSFGEKSDEI